MFFTKKGTVATDFGAAYLERRGKENDPYEQ